MNRSLFSLLGALCLGGLAHAGHFTVRSNTVLNYSAASAFANHIVSSTPSNSGAGFSLGLTTTPSKPYAHGVSGGTMTQLTVQMEVVWHPDPGDPATPGTWDAYWNVTQSATCQLKGLLAIPDSLTVGIIGAFAIDPNAFSWNQSFNSSTNINEGPSTYNDYQYGAFTFHAEGSDWVGVGGFTVTLEVDGSGSIPSPEGGGIDSAMSESFALHSINGYPIM